MKLIFATQNQHKKEEVKSLLGNELDIISLKDLNFHDELEEPFLTLQENARAKAEFIFKKFRMNCFAEDTGLEIGALGGEPGVFSARYAGPGKNSYDNIQLVLKKMEGIKNRNASFKTVICLIFNNQTEFFTGVANGRIIDQILGSSGFGYDPIFIPLSEHKTFAQMSAKEKNELSHRSKAIFAMKRFLEKIKA